MPTWDRQSFYYSGQGVLLVGSRDSLGKPKGLTAIGNCSASAINIETSVLEHKESQSGQRATDLRVTTETKCNITMTLENFASDVLALALRGDSTRVLASSVVAEAVTLYNGKVLKLANAQASAVAVRRGATTLTAYTNDTTIYDYKTNLPAGSLQMNDGSIIGLAGLTTGGTAPTAISVGASTSVTVANTAVVGDFVSFTGFAGADAALINSKTLKILTASATVITVDLNTVGKTITIGVPLSAFDGVALVVDYAWALQYRVDALTQGSAERFLRFEGLNTADGNNPVVVEVFKFLADPAQEVNLIGDDNIAQFVLQGSVLSDSLQATGSKFFKQTLLRT